MRVSKEFKVGILVVLSLLLLFITINFVKQIGDFTDVREFTVEFNRTDGLQTQDYVLLHGVKIGEVLSVDLHPETASKVIVKFNITDRSIKIPKDSELWLTSSDILGTRVLDLRIPENDTSRTKVAYYEDGDEFNPDNVRIAMSMGDSFEEQFKPIEAKTKALVERVEGIIVKINAFWDSSASYTVDASMVDVRESRIRVLDLVDNFNSIAATEKKQIVEISDQFEFVSTWYEERTQTFTDITNKVKGAADEIIEMDLGEKAKCLKPRFSALDSLFQEIMGGEGSIGIWTQTAALKNEMDSAKVKWKSLVSHLNSKPKDFIGFSIFGLKAEGYQPTKPQEKNLENVLDTLESGKEIEYKK